MTTCSARRSRKETADMPKLEGRSTHFRRVDARRTHGSTNDTHGSAHAQRGNKLDAVEEKPVVLAADLKLRTSSLASAGPTKTAIPDLVGDWKKALVESAAQQAARKEMWPDVEVILKNAEAKNGAPLDDDQRDQLVDEFFEH